ncbi:MAG TPA: glycerate-2-kinase family protein, partial [Polyangia bacterium]|nr:glycerate-2-kinase family protein [Polyangia bacterium]
MSGERRHLSAILDAALAAVEPGAAVRAALLRRGSALVCGGDVFPVAGQVAVLAIGKAAVPMTRAALDIAGELVGGGLAVTHARPPGLDRIGPVQVREAGHPLPDRRGAEAASELAVLASGLGADDLALLLLSGGGSALSTLPADGLDLDDLIATTDALLKGGAAIDELNAVRKHLTALSGGRLARLADPAPVLALALSDVPGDRLDVIASGPAAADPSTYGDALAVLDRRSAAGGVPPRVRAHLERGARGGLPETLEPGDPIFDRVTHALVGSGAVAAAAAARRAGALG